MESKSYPRAAMIAQPQLARIAAAVAFTLTVYWLLFSHQFGSPASSAVRSWASPSRDLVLDIENRTLGFQKIFVLGLADRTDRRDRMVLQAALSDLDIEFIDGPLGDEIPSKAIPKESASQKLNAGQKGCWRGHMNIMERIIQDNITTALILEDDADWDIRLREQLQVIALSSQALIQPLAGTEDTYADPSFRYREAVDESTPDGVTTFNFGSLPDTRPPAISPYGDKWDLFWLGHCGMQLPPPDSSLPRGRVVIENDPTTVAKKHLFSYTNPYNFKKDYPDHTRIIHHALDGDGTGSYAVTQQGAREILREVGLKEPTKGVDIMLRYFCNGDKGRRHHLCLGVQPPIINPYRPVGPKSDSSNIGNPSGWYETAETRMTRWSVQLNAENILNSEPIEDQFPEDA